MRGRRLARDERGRAAKKRGSAKEKRRGADGRSAFGLPCLRLRRGTLVLAVLEHEGEGNKKEQAACHDRVQGERPSRKLPRIAPQTKVRITR
jgi:hypothetical protein